MKTLSIIIGLIILIASISLTTVESKPIETQTQSYTLRTKITIESNAGFNSSNGVISGTGIISDPYIISGWEINATGIEYGIRIRNTDAYFIIENCYIHNASIGRDDWSKVGIYLYNVSNGIINNCKLGYSDLKEIYCVESNNLNINNNTLLYITVGLYFYKTNDSMINNNFYLNHNHEYTVSIYFQNSSNNLLYSNIFLHNFSREGIKFIYSSNNNTILMNNLSNFSQRSILISLSYNNNVTKNNIFNNNEGIGIYHPSENNLIYNNNFFNNTNHIREYNLGKNYFNNSYINGGNYWDTYNGTDEYSGINQDILGSDGIGDVPFEVGYTIPTRSDNNELLDEETNYDYYPILELLDFNAEPEEEPEEELPIEEPEEENIYISLIPMLTGTLSIFIVLILFSSVIKTITSNHKKKK